MYPDAPEQCDELDDCDEMIDKDDGGLVLDFDQDGFGDLEVVEICLPS